MTVRRIFVAMSLFTFATVASGQNPQAVLTSITPTTGPSTGGTIVTIRGENLLPGGCPVTCPASRVTFGGFEGQILELTATSLVVRTPAHPGGTVDVVYTRSLGTPARLASAFTYVNQGPVAVPAIDWIGRGAIGLMILGAALIALRGTTT